MKTKNILAAALLCALALVTNGAQAEETTTDTGTLDKETAAKVFPAKPPYSPYAGRNFPTRPFFGDTHLHTSLSFDAGAAVAASGRRKPIASPRASRSWPPAASR